jgi:hypothetical protein
LAVAPDTPSIPSVRRPIYPTIRDLHCYVGLFLSPFVLVFSVSAIFLVHSWLPGGGGPAGRRTITDLPVPPAFETLKGREQIDVIRALLDRAGVAGEIGFVRQFPKERRVVVPATLPGRESVFELNVAKRSATISERSTGLADAVVYLHKMPGPHNMAIRGNSAHIRAWRWLADGTVYLLLFITGSGIYLWAVLKAERRAGLTLLTAGALTLAGLVYTLIA